MTDFVCVLDRTGNPVDPRLVRRLAEPLGAYGGIPSEICRGPVGIAVVGPDNGGAIATGPAAGDGSGVGLMAGLCGRMTAIDSRDAGGRVQGPVTAERARRRFKDEGAAFLAGTTGSFALMIADPGVNTLTLARDHLGSVKAYYYLDRSWLIAASDPSSILRHPAVSGDLDEGMAARFLGFQSVHTTASYFRHIKELAPAHWIHVDAAGSRIGQYWQFETDHDAGRPDPEEVRADFRTRLEQAVAAELAGLEPEQTAISLSGGLDSTSVAALSPRGTQLHSWYFDDTPECDERQNVQSVADHLRRPVRSTRGDGLYPLCGDYTERFVHTGSPYLNPFASLKRNLYEAARETGCRRILVGDGGDVLYAAQDYWLRDLLMDRRPGALRSLASTLGAATRRRDSSQNSARMALRRLVPVRHVRSTLKRAHYPWLTEAASAALPPDCLSPVLPRCSSKYRFDAGVGAKHIEMESEERRLFARCGIERGNPFWHWPLLEKVLNLPAWWLYRDGRTKVLTREAMRGLLPDRVLDSPSVGLLGSFFLRGLELNRSAIQDLVFNNARSNWRHYVNEAWVAPYLSSTRTIGFGHTILWRVISYELWYRRVAS